MVPECLVITDRNNLPYSPTYYGLMYGLVNDLIATDNRRTRISFVDQDSLDIDSVAKYSAVHDCTLTYTPKMKEFHARAKQLQLPYVNPPQIMAICASKLETYTAVKSTGVYQPETIPLNGNDDIEQLIQTSPHHKIVVKPECGGMGTNVFFLTGTQGGKVDVAWKEIRGQAVSLRHEEMTINSFLGTIASESGADPIRDIGTATIKKRWIVQSYVDLRGEDGLARDLRIVEQREKNGLVVAKIYGRKASCPKVPLTNIDKGGKVISAEEVLDKTEIRAEELIEVCTRIDDAIEASTGKTIGEIGHDFAVVREDTPRLCFIEANTMPGYVLNGWDACTDTTRVELLDEIDRQLLLRPFRYLEELALRRSN